MSATASESRGPLPSLCVVVVNWNGRDVLDECLATLTSSGYPGLRVIMVDNGSTDDSVPFTRERFPTVEIIESAENLRWAGGNNLALSRLADEGWPSDQVLLLNNDTVIPEGALQRLTASLAATPEAWAATPRILYADDPQRVWYDGGRVGAWSGWVRHEGIRRRARDLDEAERFVEYGTGCALLLTRQCLEACDLLDTDFYFYGEDVDYSQRIRGSGGRILQVPSALVLHKVSATLGVASPQKVYLRSRSHVRILRRHWRGARVPVLIGSQAVYIAGHMAWHLWHGRAATALALVEGVLDEVCRRPLPTSFGGQTSAGTVT